MPDPDVFNPEGRPTAKFEVSFRVGKPWSMGLEWLGSYFENLDADERLTVEYAIFEETLEVPIINVIAEDFVEVRISSPLGYFRVLDSKGNELPL